MPSKFLALPMVLLAARALCSAFDFVSSRDTFDSTILPTSKNFTPIPYNISASPISPGKGERIVMFEFDQILLNAAGPFSGIFWGSALPNVTEIFLGVPEGVRILDEAANYSTACSNASTIFSSTLIFTNCLVLGFTSVLLHGGLISLDEDLVQNANMYLHFGDIHSFNGSGVLDDITTCISATCQNTSTSTCSWDITSNLTEAYDSKHNATEKLSRLYSGFNAYCDGQMVQPNSDVLGPGVLIASFTQVAAVSFFFLVSKFHRWARRLKALRQRHCSWSDGRTFVPLDPQADLNLKPNGFVRALIRFSTAVESISVDFQEAQIFFVLTIQIATFWFFNPTKVIENSSTYAEVSNTSIWAKSILVVVILPVLLGQTVLQRSGRHWWYTSFLTTVAALVTLVFINTPLGADYSTFWTKLKNENPISQCGGNPSPNTYCGVSGYTKIYGESSQLTEATAKKDILILQHEGKLSDVVDFILIWAPTFLLADQLFIWICGLQLWKRTSQFCKRASHWDTLSGPTQGWITKVSRTLIWVIWTAHQSLLVISLVLTSSILLFLFNALTPLAGGWSYGQLVAALIWAPLGLKLVYYTFFGAERSVENRIKG
ncbi:hypothetical protein GQX73_g7580 [Xylaria multiplex]|uniref:Autophagy-related protein n=1 Tax=Xylaria multiplex TaxID=323545 RepID=A0A7C8INC4_9PEZI|nr:hypothetical protein GQX73_g7580 [Xylaria multiplex]